MKTKYILPSLLVIGLLACPCHKAKAVAGSVQFSADGCDVVTLATQDDNGEWNNVIWSSDKPSSLPVGDSDTVQFQCFVYEQPTVDGVVAGVGTKPGLMVGNISKNAIPTVGAKALTRKNKSSASPIMMGMGKYSKGTTKK